MYDLELNFLTYRSGKSRNDQTKGGSSKKLGNPSSSSHPKNVDSGRVNNIPVASDPDNSMAEDVLNVGLNNFTSVSPTLSLAKTRFNFQEIFQQGHNQNLNTSSVSLPQDCKDPGEVHETRTYFKPWTEYLLINKDIFHAAVRESIANQDEDHSRKTKLASITTGIEIQGYGDLEVSIEFTESMTPSDYKRVNAFNGRNPSPGEANYSFIYNAIYEAGIAVQATEILEENLSDSAKCAARKKFASGELGPLELNDSNNVIVIGQAEDFTIKYFQISASSGMIPLKVFVDPTANTNSYVAIKQSINPQNTNNNARTPGQSKSTNLLTQAQNLASDTGIKINLYYVAPLIVVTAISASVAPLLPLGLANFSNIAILGSGVISLACSIRSNRLGKIIKSYESREYQANEYFLANFKTSKRRLDIVGSSCAGLSLGLGGALVAASSSLNGLPYVDILGTSGMIGSAFRPVTVGFNAVLSGLNKVKGGLTTWTNQWIQNAGTLFAIALSKAKPGLNKLSDFLKTEAKNRK